MSKFFVGQRVKIVACGLPDGNHMIGHEGRIIGPCAVYKDAYDVSGAEWLGGRLVSWFGPHLAPILPEGHQPAELTVHELLPFLKTTADA